MTKWREEKRDSRPLSKWLIDRVAGMPQPDYRKALSTKWRLDVIAVDGCKVDSTVADDE